MANHPPTVTKYLCEDCGTLLPLSYPSCLKCGRAVPAVLRLRDASLHLSLLVRDVQARRAEEAAQESDQPVTEWQARRDVVDDPTQYESDIGPAMQLEAVEAVEAADDADDADDADEQSLYVPEPIQIMSVRNRRSWLRLPFLRKAS